MLNTARIVVEPYRPLFKPDRMRKNPITGIDEPYFSGKKRRFRLGLGSSLCMTIAMLVVIISMSIVVYRIAVREALFLHGGSYVARSGPIAAVTAALINLVAIILLSYVYQFIAIMVRELLLLLCISCV